VRSGRGRALGNSELSHVSLSELERPRRVGFADEGRFFSRVIEPAPCGGRSTRAPDVIGAAEPSQADRLLTPFHYLLFS